MTAQSLTLVFNAIGVIGVVGAIWFIVRRYAPAINTQATMDASSATAETWRKRSEAQESEIKDLRIEVESLASEVRTLREEQRILKANLVSPEALARFESTQSTQTEILKAIHEELTRSVRG